MQYSVIKKVILIIFHIIGIHCSTYKNVVVKIRYLENRAQDYADIIERLDGIDKRLNESLEQSVGFVDNVGPERSGKDDGEHLREDFTRIRRAFGEEKSESSRIRREIPKIENKLFSVKQDMERYCVKNLNNTEQLVTLAGEAGENLKNEITNQINENKREQLSLLLDINKTTVKEFELLSSQIEQIKVDTAENNANIKREQLALHLDLNKTTVKEFEFLSSKIEEIKGDIAENNANINREQSSLLLHMNNKTEKEFELLSSQIEQIKVDTAENNADMKREQLALHLDLNKTTVKEFEFLSSKIEEIKGDIAENNANINREQSSLLLHMNNKTEKEFELLSSQIEQIKVDTAENNADMKREQLALHLDLNKTTVKEFEFLSSKIEEIKGDIAENNANIKREQSSLLHDIYKTTVKEFELLSSQIEQIKVDTAENNANIKRGQSSLLHDINKTTVKEFELLSSQIEQIKVDIAENNANIKREQLALLHDINKTTVKEFELLSSQIEQIKVDTAENNEIINNINLIRLAGGGWTVFQRRQNGKVDFYRNWSEYKYGFGDLNGEFWLGNKYLSILTASGDHELRIDMEDFDGNRAFAKYSKFKVFPEEDKYKLEVSGYSGNAGDSLGWYHNGMSFSTFDNDNDEGSENCASEYHGAWWYNACFYSNLNGKYYNERNKYDDKGINWYTWKKKNYCLKFVEMKFRARN